MLLATLERTAQQGRLAVPVLQAAELIHSASMGVTLTLVGQDASTRNPNNSPVLREATLAAILIDGAPMAHAAPAALAVALSASLDEATPLTQGQRAMLDEMLDAIASPRGDSARGDSARG